MYAAAETAGFTHSWLVFFINEFCMLSLCFSSGTLHYALHVLSLRDTDATRSAMLDIEGGLYGELAARASKPITLNFTPAAADYHALRLVCSVSVSDEVRHDPNRLAQLGSMGSDMQMQVSEAVANQDGPQAMSCNVTCMAALPHVGITDVRMPHQPLYNAWQQFHIDDVNMELGRGLSPYELHLREAERRQQSQKAQELYENLPAAIFHFGMAQNGSQPDIAFIKLQNLGDLDVEWVTKFPDELEVEKDRWADGEDPSPQQVAFDQILDNRLFEVKPRSGELAPGQSVVVQAAYFHRLIGHHDLPVVLRW